MERDKYESINEYCKRNFIPEPYRYCDHILNKVNKLLNEYDESFKEIWGWVNRNLINIYGIFIDERLISEDEFCKLKDTL